MSTSLRTYLFVLAALAGFVGCVVLASGSPPNTPDRGHDQAEAASGLRSAQLEMSGALHDFLESGEASALADYREAGTNFRVGMSAARLSAGDAAAEQASLERQALVSERWQALAERQILARQGNLIAGGRDDENDGILLGRFMRENDELKVLLADQRRVRISPASSESRSG